MWSINYVYNACHNWVFVYHTDCLCLSTAGCCEAAHHAGLSTTADTSWHLSNTRTCSVHTTGGMVACWTVASSQSIASRLSASTNQPQHWTTSLPDKTQQYCCRYNDLHTDRKKNKNESSKLPGVCRTPALSDQHTRTTTIVLQPLYRSTYISQHLQLRTGEFCCAKFYWLGRRRWSSLQQCYLHCLCTFKFKYFKY